MFTNLFSNESFIPKLHYMLHYPQQILNHGIRAWTMRFEGKLKYFKNIVQIGNFKNITLTLTKRHQRWLAYHIQSDNLFTSDITRGPIIQSKTLKEETKPIQDLLQQNIHGISSDDNCVSLRWVTINGIKYTCENCFLMTSVEKSDIPNFGQVAAIVSINMSTISLVISSCKVIGYNSHLLAYAVEFNDNLSLLPSASIPYCEILHIRKQLLDSQPYLAPTVFLLD